MPSGATVLALSAAALSVALGRRVPAGAPELAELAAAGAVVRRGHELVVDPSLQAALAVWQDGPVRLDAVVRDGRGVLQIAAGACGPVAACLVSGLVAGRPVEPVHVLVPGVAGLVAAVVSRVPFADSQPPASAWVRVRGHRTAWFLLCRNQGSGWQRVLPAPPAFGAAVRHEPVDGEGLARVLAVALAGALVEEPAWR